MIHLLALAALPGHADVIPLKLEAGALVVPAVIDDKVELGFTIDSGASDVSVPASVYLSLIRAGTLSREDMLDIKRYQLADGSEYSSRRFRIRSLRVGNVQISNVVGSVTPNEGMPLLGQSFLSKLSSWSIDNAHHVLLLNEEQGARATSQPARASIGDADPSQSTAFRRMLAFLMTGDDKADVRLVDRSRCSVEVRRRIWPDAPELVSVVHLNRVDRTQSRIIAVPDVPRNRVDIILRGEGVVEYPARPALPIHGGELPREPAHSVSEETITLYTDDAARVQNAWDFIYSHGCSGAKGTRG
jgi:hypothetical protein